MVSVIVGALGFTLATVSLTWQIVAWRLSGGRARADLFIGAIQPTGVAYFTLPAKTSVAVVGRLGGEDFTRKALFITVRNTGRLPIMVERLLVRFLGKYRMAQLAFAVGPKMPHRLEIGESETWGVELEKITQLAQVLRVGKRLSSVKVRAEIELGNSKVISTRQKARL